MNKRTLHFVLKHQWWNMIESLEKPEEYRDLSILYCSRLLDKNNGKEWVKATKRDFNEVIALSDYDAIELRHLIDTGTFRFRDYDEVCFHKGYTNVTMTFEFKGISIGFGNPKWGAPTDREVFKIKLGKRI